ncbi:thymidine kinase [Metamycoplasma alkalescens]|uniref:Thymidine kinase n=1 Tax=Metamycoplasma alkalescens TaxID=45363 RepID=A0A318U4W3_9BACT|nr:thymidine kinase [Metamycoplasma alkalescens]PYF43081.1 thymidine kinase [Metamycoplasma alkalescens]SYV90211.1 thymidine kinase [Metamycoplasma alkalescens]
MYKKFSDGMIEVITGPMFSGKSEELLKKLRTLSYAKFDALVIKPDFDSRFSKDEIVSRCGLKEKTFTIKDIKDIYSLLEKKKYQAILIDEAHFFSNELVDVVDDLANKGYLIIVAGLDQDYQRKPFGPIPNLMAIAEKVTKLQAICVVCQNIATTSYKKINNHQLHFLGDYDEYEARCRKCHNKGNNL